MKRVYLDHSATTPVRPEVAKTVSTYMTEKYGNPSSLHSWGREAKEALERAREQVAGVIKAKPEEVFFTSGGTESDNLAIIGAARHYAPKGKHLITTAVEHHAVLDAFHVLEEEGFTVTILPVDESGMVRLEQLRNALTQETILISVMQANNEVGTIQPVEEIGHLAREHGIVFHVDAVQSLGKIPVDVSQLNVDLLSGSGHKIYGPKGTGFLYVKKGVGLDPLLYGGGQESLFRPGTENLAGIVGMGLASELADRDMKEEMEKLARLRDLLVTGLQERISGVSLNGHPEKRVAVNANLSFAGVEGESLLLALDMKGIAASSGSACSSGSVEPSHVLLAMGLEPQRTKGAVRMTLGRDNTEEDIRYVLDTFPPIVNRLREMAPLHHAR